MKDINAVTLTGRLTRDSELKYTGSGYAICNLSLAYSRSQKVNGEWSDKSCFIDCTIWGKRGEALTGMLKKGVPVCVAGELDHQRWEKDGQVRTKHVLMVNEIRVFGGKKQTTEQESATTTAAPPADDFDDDVPF